MNESIYNFLINRGWKQVQVNCYHGRSGYAKARWTKGDTDESMPWQDAVLIELVTAERARR